MAKIKVAVYGTTGRVVEFDPKASVGATIGTDLLMPDGSVATLAKLAAAIGSGSTTPVGSTGAIAHSSLAGLALGDDHPQYLRKDTLTTDGDIYVRTSGVPARFGIGANHTVLTSTGSAPAWADISGNPTAHVGLTAVNGTANTFMRSDGAPALDQGISPHWTAQHTFDDVPLVGSTKVVLESRTITAGTGLTGGGDLTANRTLTVDDSHWATVAFTGDYSDLSGTPTIPPDVSAATFLTVDDETGTLTNSRQVLAGTNITFDDTTPGQRTINASGGGGSSPLTTKGDIWGYDTVDARVPVGSDGDVLTADSGAALGVSWQPASGTGTVTSVDITPPAAGITASGGPITTSGAITLALADDLAAVEGLSTNGMVARTAANTWTTRTITGTANRIAVTNGDGVSGNPTLDIDAAYVGQASITTLGTIASGTWHGTAIDLGSYASGTLQAAQFPALTGDVTTSAGSLATAIGAGKVTTTMIAANAVTLAKLAAQADQTILGNNSGGSAVPSALTATQIKTLLAIAYTDVSGLATVAHTGAYSDLSGTPTLLTSPLTTKGDIWGFSTVNARVPVGTNGFVLTADSTAALGVKWAAGGSSTGANPSASVGLSAVNGSASTFLRSDGAPALSQSIAPTWTGAHTFTNAAGVVVSNAEPFVFLTETGQAPNEKAWGWEAHNKHMYLGAYTDAYGSRNNIFDVTRGTGTALVDLSFGNATDNPSFTFLGNGASSFAGTMALSAPGGGTPLTITPAAGERGIEVTGATAAGSSLYLRNTSGSDGRCVVAYSADLTTFQTYLLGIDTTGSNVKNFELRNVTSGTKPFVCTVNGEFTLDTPTSGITLTVNALATKAGVVINPGNSASVGMQITDPGAAGVLGRLSTTNASFILTAVNGTTLLNVGASTIATVSSTGVNVGGLIVSKAPTSGVGYATGAGGTVTQATSRTTGVTLSKVCGAITLVSAAGTAAWQTFTVTNTTVAAADTVLVVQKSGTDLNQIHVTNVAAGSFKISFATTGGTTTEQPVFNFAVIKAVTA